MENIIHLIIPAPTYLTIPRDQTSVARENPRTGSLGAFRVSHAVGGNHKHWQSTKTDFHSSQYQTMHLLWLTHPTNRKD